MSRAVVALFALALSAWAARGMAQDADSTAEARPVWVGERLTFAVRYGFITAGEATMEVAEEVDCGSGRCYRIISEARSTKPFSFFYEVEDRVESLMDVEGLFTRRYEKDLKEGSYRKNEVVTFDQEKHTATYPDSTVHAIPDRVQDALTSLYFLRTFRLETGRSVFIDNHADGKNYLLEARILRSETVSVPAGRFDCFVVEPVLRASGIFQHKGRLTVWLTSDERLMPVMMKSKIIVGSVDAVLTDFTRTPSDGGTE